MIGFFSPTIFEVPPTLLYKTKTFGIGHKRAVALARKLEGSPFSKILIFGCAGALHENIRSGQIFLVETLSTGVRMEATDLFPNLPRAKLFSSKTIVTGTEKKREIQSLTQASLVDMEMEFLWEAATSATRKKFIFIRGVLDELNDGLFSMPYRWLNYQKNISATLRQNLRISD